MSDATKLRSDWHRLGAGLSVQFEMRGERFDAEWRPRMPTKRELRRLLPAYRSARDGFMADVARSSGKDMMLIELGGDDL